MQSNVSIIFTLILIICRKIYITGFLWYMKGFFHSILLDFKSHVAILPTVLESPSPAATVCFVNYPERVWL